MRIYVSLSVPGFFAEEKRPDDAQEISTQLWQELLGDGNAPGKKIDFSVYPPSVVDWQPPAPDLEEQKRIAEDKRRRLLEVASAAIAPLQDAIDLGIVTEQEKMLLSEWRSYRVQLMRMDISKPDWPVPPGEI